MEVKLWGVGTYRAFLYVFVSAFTYEAYYFAPAFYFSPFSSIASDVLRVDFPQYFCFLEGYRRVMFC